MDPKGTWNGHKIDVEYAQNERLMYAEFVQNEPMMEQNEPGTVADWTCNIPGMSRIGPIIKVTLTCMDGSELRNKSDSIDMHLKVCTTVLNLLTIASIDLNKTLKHSYVCTSAENRDECRVSPTTFRPPVHFAFLPEREGVWVARFDPRGIRIAGFSGAKGPKTAPKRRFRKFLAIFRKNCYLKMK